MERELLLRFKTAREAAQAANEALKSARAEERQAEAAIVEYLEANQASATGKYDGLGWCQINRPTLYASATQDIMPSVLAWLKENGHESAVKETVHHSTLSQIVGEMLQEGKALPDGITYYMKPNVRLYGG